MLSRTESNGIKWVFLLEVEKNSAHTKHEMADVKLMSVWIWSHCSRLNFIFVAENRLSDRPMDAIFLFVVSLFDFCTPFLVVWCKNIICIFLILFNFASSDAQFEMNWTFSHTHKYTHTEQTWMQRNWIISPMRQPFFFLPTRYVFKYQSFHWHLPFAKLTNKKTQENIVQFCFFCLAKCLHLFVAINPIHVDLRANDFCIVFVCSVLSVECRQSFSVDLWTKPSRQNE